jgi:hypothetical protein
MNTVTLTKKFEMMGARVKLHKMADLSQRRGFNEEFRIDVRKDREGEFFDLTVGAEVGVDVLDVKPEDRHLLLIARTSDNKSKFLLGHDERSWFVAAIPEKKTSVASVVAAKEALKPDAVIQAEADAGVKSGKRQRRKNNARIRQGEFFLIPRPNLKVNEKLILKNEPLRRGRSKPHMAEFLYRIGGETVYVNRHYRNGITKEAYQKMSAEQRKDGNFTVMSRNPKVYIKGSLRHPDHKTVYLQQWHEVQMNTELSSRAMSSVAFLD